MTSAAQPSTPLAILFRTFGRYLTRAAVIVMLGVSASLLMNAGVPYGSPGGSQLAKIHPGTYLAVLAAVCILVADGWPGRTVGRIWRDHPGILAYAAAIGVLAFQAVGVQHMPLSPLIDTFVSSLMLFLALTRLPEKDTRWLAFFIHAFFFLNSAIGYVEQATPFRLTPTYNGPEVVTFEWRSTAMLGHPLTNAAQTGLYLILLTGPGGRIFDPRIRMGLVLLHLGAMACFGGRTSFVLALGMLALRGGLSALAMIGGRRIRLTSAMALAGIGTAAMMAAVVLVDAGAFDRFLGRFEDDQGSASTRLAMLHVFDRLSWEAAVIAPDPRDIGLAQQRLGIKTAIESFVVGFPAYYGFLVSGLFFAGLGCFLMEIVRAAGRAAVLPVLFWLAVNAGANGISTKTLDLSIALASIVLLCPDRSGAVGARGRVPDPTRTRRARLPADGRWIEQPR